MAEIARQQLGESSRIVEPLRVTASLASGIVFNFRPMLDGILAAVYARRAGLNLIPISVEDLVPIQVPIATSGCGRFALCSEAQFDVEEHEDRYKQRRPVTEQFARLAPKVKSVKITGGPNKAYRVPYRVQLMRDDVVTWYALGDRAMVTELLQEVFFLGKHRGSGKGQVESWDVEPCDPWEGFPILQDGTPLRPLPEDYPGVTGARFEYRVLTPPYWMQAREQVCAVG